MSQAARFTAKPKMSHVKAIKTIVCYLKKDTNKGIIVKPDGTYNVKCWVDADFAGNFGSKPNNNPKSCKSRHGYVITCGGVPLIWKSQLIKEICLSTLHAEYVGLSQALQAMIPIQSLMLDTLLQAKLGNHKKPFMVCKVFEDNQGCYLLATKQQLSACTKHFSVKFYFFWQFLHHEEQNPDGWLLIKPCSTAMMDADCLTKGLARVKQELNRRRVQGW